MARHDQPRAHRVGPDRQGATDRYEMPGSAGLSPDAIAWSFDGMRQALFAGSLVKIVEPERLEFEVEGASVAAAERAATMSHDGRFLVLASQASGQPR
jgi:hypothetical protein